MIKYIKPYEITPEMERTIKRNAKHDAEEQKENPQKIFWFTKEYREKEWEELKHG